MSLSLDRSSIAYRPHIDGLRGVAVLAVVWFHAFPDSLPGGFVGVDVFFVISGFLISSILYREVGESGWPVTRVIGRFYARRIRRIFPALVLVLTATLLIGLHVLLPSELMRLARQTLASAGFFQNFFLADRVGYFDSAAESNPLLHLWSLAIEEQFYLVWPFLVWVAFRSGLKALPVAVFFAAGSFSWSLRKYAGTEAEAFFLPQIRIWELLLGAIAAAVVRAPSEPGGDGRTAGDRDGFWARRGLADNLTAGAGLLLVVAGILTIEYDENFTDRGALLPTLGAVGIVASTGSAWCNRVLLSTRPLVWIGLISYPLYLWHWPLLAFARIGSAEPLSVSNCLLVLAVSLVLSWLTYRFVERPLRHRAPTKRLLIGWCGALAGVCLASYGFLQAKGFPGRFPPLISAISTFEYDHAAATRLGTYFLMGDRDEKAFKVDPNEILPGKPTLYLWGDSHAACLYSGFKEVYGPTHNVVQRTAAKTPPFVPEFFNAGVEQQINRHILELIVRDQPEVVVVDANWESYDWRKIEATILALKAARIQTIIIVGPVPQWPGGLPQQLFNYVRDHRDEPVPVRLDLATGRRTAALDEEMASMCERLAVHYVSAWKIFSGEGGVLVRTGETPDSLLTYDQSHLTPRAAIYLVSNFPAPLLPTRERP